jgi:hypothetical protein
MRRRHFVLIALAGLTVGAGLCIASFSTTSHTVDVVRLRGPYRAQVHVEGQLAEEHQIAAGSPAEEAVAAWLAAHSGGWAKSLVTYAPRRVIRGERFNLNLLPDGLCVLNYESADGPVQVTRRVSAAEMNELVVATGQE